jgi:predicted permease
MDTDADYEGAGVDSGLARERTELAWSRSGLAVAVTVAVILRRLWPLSNDKAVLALVTIATGAILWAVGMQLGRHSRRGTNPEGALTMSTCRLMTMGTLLLAAAGFAVGLFLPQ